MPFYTYMLRCSDGTYYVGHTDDLENRIPQHQSGLIPGYTATRLPVELVWSDTFPSRYEALSAERQLKGWSRKKKEALIAGDWDRVSELASRANVLRDGDEPSTSSVSSPPQDERGLMEDTKQRLIGSRRKPVIVLVRPQLGENIGKAARAMLNFGLTELRLVTPRDGWPNPSAGPAAAGADVVLEHAQVFETLADAVADCAHVYATTVRKRGVSKPVLTPEQAAQAVHREVGRSAYVFGPERSGLETEDVALARAIVTVPINPEFGSLNLAQAVILLAYEWSKHAALAQPTVEELLPPAPQEELEGMIAQLETMLEPTGYYRPQARAAATRLTLRNMLTKPGWNHLEVRTMRGVLSALRKGPRKT
ncbi:TrmJ/YjtD family RNA methyltransferase [Novosphingobium sp.]|uniref:TrmJ/YjtD family RNA methyltransferase n=1 Tax=Novosphingobium sp. TaxID=1874826 RepID=UPI0025FADFE1|nr:TrmJ/YjtD family RNA methyltransferase [Novosphingobium sp.]MCC6925868.1 TrmJ/YjtD family RNA methyltransferase [Novosphingobium sp.]